MQKLMGIEIHKFKYDSEEQREEHVAEMKAYGYECASQKKNRDSFSKDSESYWYGEFYKAI